MRNAEIVLRPNAEMTDYAGAFARALLDPDREAPAGLTERRRKSIAKRYNVYRNNVTVSLIDALAAIYPAVRRLTGDDFFRALARAHVRASPPTSPLLFEYGCDLPQFIEGYAHAQATPWLADVCRLERAWLDAYHAAEAPTLSANDLANVASERIASIVFRPHPAARIVQSPFPVCSLFAMARSGEDIVPLASAEPEDALVIRPEAEVVVRRLPPGGATFLNFLLRGQPLGAAASAALGADPDFDLAANIAGMIEAGVFEAMDKGDFR